MQSFIVAVQHGYLPMPFHNFSHAVYVLHGCVMCLRNCPLLYRLLSPLERACLCIAALGHDIGHLGVQNAFLVRQVGFTRPGGQSAHTGGHFTSPGPTRG